MLNIDFYNMFVNIDFDSLLSETNNPLINSKEFYLNYKNDYFDQTNKNYSKFLRCNSELQKIKDNQYKIENNRYNFIYLNQNKLESLKSELKSIILKQNELFDNFKHHIYLLNKDSHLFIVPTQINQTKSKGLLSLFNKSRRPTKNISLNFEQPTLKRSKSNASIKSNKSIKSVKSFKSFME